jgi:lysine 6-dehydrogenase
MLDLGGNTDITRETLGLHAQAKAAGITIVPDTGLAPGLVISVAAYFIESLDHVETIKLYCGGLPQHPKPPFNYKLSFNIEGLVTEYSGKAITLRNGEIRMVDTLKELETLRFEELGALEAFTTSGGVSTAPYTWQGKVNNFEYKTLRYPGHCQIMRIFKDCGFWNLDPIELDGQKIRPRDVFHKLMGEALKDPTAKDLVVVRGIARGHQKGISKQLQIDILEKHDDQTGFSAMERLTGFSSSIYAIEIAQGNVKHGCIPYEKAVSGKHVLREIQRRGVRVKYSETELE